MSANLNRRVIGLDELSKLNGRHNAAIAYRGKVYDVSGFLEKHPGGADLLLRVAGQDVTNFFDVYHDSATRKLLPSKCKVIGDFEEGSPEEHERLEKDKLYRVLEGRVREHFKKNGIDPKIHIPYFCVAMSVVIMTPAVWCLAILSASLGWSLLAALLLSLLSGFCAALNALQVGHDASHFAWTHSPRVWKVLSAFLCCVHGISTYVWFYQHVFAHHTHPNHDRLDPDVATKHPDFWRIKPFQARSRHYLYQHIYMPLLFSLLSIKMKVQDFHSMLTLTKANIRITPPTTEAALIFLATKAIHIAYRVVLPSFFVSFPLLLLMNLLSELVMGLWLGIVTQLNHVNSELTYFNDSDSENSKMSWSRMQVAATADYAVESRLWHFLTGSLNAQVVHHLFPWVLSYHYRGLIPIVRATLEEFGVKYHCYESFWAIWGAHLGYLRDMGQDKVGTPNANKME